MWVAQQFFGGSVLGKFCAQKSFIRRVLEQASHQVGHARQQLAHRAVFAHAITQLDERTLDRTGHSIKQLKLETTAIDPEFVRKRLCVRDAANVVRPERGGND